MFKSLQQLGTLSASTWSNPSQFRYVERGIVVNPNLVDPQGWDDYWKAKQRTSTFAYEVAAAIYRNLTLKGRLNHFMRKHFPARSKLLHAGCGGGQVDQDIQQEMFITPLDISVPALQLYQRNNPDVCLIRRAGNRLEAKLVRLDVPVTDVVVVETSKIAVAKDGRVILYDGEAIEKATSRIDAKHEMSLGCTGEPRCALVAHGHLFVGTSAGEVMLAVIVRKQGGIQI